MKGFRLGQTHTIADRSLSWTLTGTGQESPESMLPFDSDPGSREALTLITVQCECTDGRIAFLQVGVREEVTDAMLLARIRKYLALKKTR